MKLNGLPSAVVGLLLLMGLAIPAGLAVSCGSTSGSTFGSATSSDGGDGGAAVTEPYQEFQCAATVSDTLLDADTLAMPAPLACAPVNVDAEALTEKCESKCEAGLSAYAGFFDNDAAVPVIVADLSCTIGSTTGINMADGGPLGCPDADPPSNPDPLFTGGPAQYVADLSGDLSLSVDTGTVVGTVGFGPFPMSGEIAYAIAPLDLNCPSAGCSLLITSLNLQAPTFTASKSASSPEFVGEPIGLG